MFPASFRETRIWRTRLGPTILLSNERTQALFSNRFFRAPGTPLQPRMDFLQGDGMRNGTPNLDFYLA